MFKPHVWLPPCSHLNQGKIFVKRSKALQVYVLSISELLVSAREGHRHDVIDLESLRVHFQLKMNLIALRCICGFISANNFTFHLAAVRLQTTRSREQAPFNLDKLKATRKLKRSLENVLEDEEGAKLSLILH
jgi:hypothetical protein